MNETELEVFNYVVPLFKQGKKVKIKEKDSILEVDSIRFNVWHENESALMLDIGYGDICNHIDIAD